MRSCVQNQGAMLPSCASRQWSSTWNGGPMKAMLMIEGAILHLLDGDQSCCRLPFYERSGDLFERAALYKLWDPGFETKVPCFYCVRSEKTLAVFESAEEKNSPTEVMYMKWVEVLRVLDLGERALEVSLRSTEVHQRSLDLWIKRLILVIMTGGKDGDEEDPRLKVRDV